MPEQVMPRLIAFLVLFAFATRSVADDAPKATVDALVAKPLKGKKSLGLVVGVLKDGKPHVFGYGTVKLPAGDAAPAGDTVFEIGSVTKAFTGLLLAEAVRRGEVKLDDPAQKHLPADWKLPTRGDTPITLEHLSTHFSGLPVQPPLIGLLAKNPANPYADFDHKRLKYVLDNLKLERDVGKEYHYSNLGAGLLGHALAHAAKSESYEKLVIDRIAKPLGMKDTFITPSDAQKARFVRGTDEDGKPTSNWDFATLEACGGLRSTANDLLKFAAANLGDTKAELLPALLDAHKPRRTAEGGKLRIGLGWHLGKLPDGSDSVWHNGGTGGFSSFLGLAPKAKTAVVVITNRGDHDISDEIAVELLAKLTAAKK
jgi:CubicO group peptidase (beta-lactamase class C family)